VTPVLTTGERVVTPAGGFNPTWQRHVAAYRLCAPLLGDGEVLDLGCGVGHSFAELAPRRSTGVDLDAAALAGQDRPTVVADMRDLPFADATFASTLSVHALEHVPDPERIVAEARRVTVPGGTIVFVTPNRLTFSPPGEIVDPYHHVEFDPAGLAALLPGARLLGIFGSPRYAALVARERRTLDRALALDPLRLRARLPRRVLQVLYDGALTVARRRHDPVAAAITPEDFRLEAEGLERALDLVAVLSR
jgi:SAM-dependent methyltransferase